MPSHDASLHESYASAKRMEVEEMEVRRGPPRFGPAPITFGQKAKRHCSRWWWLHLMVFCITFLTSSLLLTYVGLPKIAQKNVNDSSITFSALVFSEPTPTSFLLSQNATLHSPSIFTPTLDGYNASLYTVIEGNVSNISFASFEMPAVHVQHPQVDVGFSNVTVTINDMDQMATFSAMTLSLQNITMAIAGKTNLHLGAFPTVGINYFTEVTYSAFNSLKGFNVTDIRLNLNAAAGQPNMQGIAYIQNPSIMTIVMGEVVMSVSIDKVGTVGNTTIQNMVLRPGDNYLNITGMLDAKTVYQSQDSSGMVNLTVSGQSAVYNGQHLPYYEAALQQSKLPLPLNVTQILKDSASGQ